LLTYWYMSAIYQMKLRAEANVEEDAMEDV
jgi:hypothetical protein